MNIERNPERYRQLCEPFESEEECNEATHGFFKEVGELRVKYGLPDVLVNVSCYLLRDGEELQVGSRMYFGNSVNELPILAAAYGSARTAWNHLIDRMSEGRLKD